MMRLWSTTVLVLTAIFVLLIAGVRLQSQDSAPTDLGHCAQPCWKGVQPGITLAHDAVVHLNAVNRLSGVEAQCQPVRTYTCVWYIWSSTDDPSLYTEVEVHSGEVGNVIAYNPDLSFGAALLALSDQGIDLDGTQLSMIVGNRFDAEVMFADSHLVMEVVAPCASSYFDLMQRSINALEIDSLQSDSLDTPSMSFADMRRRFYKACAILQ